MKFKLYFAAIYFRLKKNIYWHNPRNIFASEINQKTLKYEIFKHKSPLRRNLPGDELWMQENKIENLKIAIARINGLILNPEENFSYWKLIGNPTSRKGYKKGMILKRGKVKSGVGGGLCQLSNIIYWITLHSPLSVVERWRHSYDIFPDADRTQPFGTGATCSYPNIDLQIENKTKREFQLILSLDENYLHASWFSDKLESRTYKIHEKAHQIKQELNGKYSRHNLIFRETIDEKTGKILFEEKIAENHALMMYSPLLGN